jgi:uncharacterized protein (UPF0548 family)
VLAFIAVLPWNGVLLFTYVTLQGHAEKGVASFLISREHDATGERLTFNIESWSVSGHGLAKAIAPLPRLLQKAITLEALDYFRRSVGGDPTKPLEGSSLGLDHGG